jgi:hypothetical protein
MEDEQDGAEHPMKRIAFAAFAVLAFVGRPAQADEAATHFVKLFSDVCIARFGHLDMVEDWAQDKALPPISNPQALAVLQASRTVTAR